MSLSRRIGTVSHLVGLIGQILIRVQLLNAARKLSERHVGVTSQGRSRRSFRHRIRSKHAYDFEVYVSLTIDTAHEYIKLGRAEEAASILAHVLPGVRSGSLPPMS